MWFALAFFPIWGSHLGVGMMKHHKSIDEAFMGGVLFILSFMVQVAMIVALYNGDIR